MESKIGFGFRPTDDELVGHFLLNKIKGKTELVDSINEVEICSFDPWDLRLEAKIKSRDPVWYFFSKRENKYASGNRQSRRTSSGYWKLTGESVEIKDQWGTWCGTPQGKIGSKRVLGFHLGKSGNSKGVKSDWVIHEYHLTLLPEHQRSHVICRLEYKGVDMNMLTGNPIVLTPPFVANPTQSAGSVIDQGNSSSYHAYAEYDSLNQYQQQQSTGYFDMQQQQQQPLQGSYNVYDLQQPVQGSYNNLYDYGWFGDSYNLQQQVPYNEADMWADLVNENRDSLIDERTYMQQNNNDYRPKKPESGVFDDESSGDSDIDSMIRRDAWSSTDSVGSSNGPYTSPIEEQEQPKPLKLQLQGKEKVLTLVTKQTSECKCKDTMKKGSSASMVDDEWIVMEEMNQRKSQWNYLKNMIIGFLLLISIIVWIILSG